MEDKDPNRFSFMGTVIEISEVKQFSAWLRKRDFKIRFTDVDFANKIQERVVKLTTINDQNSLLDECRIDDDIKVEFYIEGRDFVKDGKTLNFTNLICYDIKILRSPSRDTKEDKNAVVTNEGRDYKPVIKPATNEELAGYMVEGDPLVQFPVGKESEKKIVNNIEIDPLPF